MTITTNGHFPETCPTCHRAASPPTTPSDAAMQAATPVVAREIAEEVVALNRASVRFFDVEHIAALVERHLTIYAMRRTNA